MTRIRLPLVAPVFATILTQVFTIAVQLAAVATDVAPLAAHTGLVALATLSSQFPAIMAKVAPISGDLTAVATNLSPILPPLDGFAAHGTRRVGDDVRPHRDRCGDLSRSGAPAGQREHEEQPYGRGLLHVHLQ